MSRWRLLLAGAGAAVVAVAAYLLVFSNAEATPTIRVSFATAVIGEGDDAVGVTPDGEILAAEPPPAEGTLPSLPAAQPPKSGLLSGPMLAQAKVLGAAPEPLRPCIARSSFGETGVVVELRSGIEIAFGDATRAAEKWESAIALLADPSITAVDYVDVTSPRRPATGGSGHALPPTGEAPAGGCGE